MLPGTRGDRETTRQILLYSIVLVAFTVAVGWWLGPRLHRSRPRSSARTSCCSPGSSAATPRAADAVLLFHYSLAYLALLFVAAAIDPLVL